MKGLNFKEEAEEAAACMDINDEMALRKAEEAASRRFQAAQWLRQMDQVASETLQEEPSEEEFCLALRNGLILCNVLNKVNPGAIPKIVENPVIAVEATDGAAQSAIQYFENMRNFLVAVANMKLLTFEASDLEKGGSSVKVVDCMLCLKGYHEWKLAGGVGIWRYGGIVKITSSNQMMPSSLLGGTESSYKPTLLHDQQVSELLHLFSEATLEETKAASAFSFLFDRFGLLLLRAFLAEWSGVDDCPLNSMLIDMVLEKSVEELYVLLSSRKDQLGYALKSMMKAENKAIPRKDFLDSVTRYLNENSNESSCCLINCSHGGQPSTDDMGRLDLQQKQLEELKSSFDELRVQFYYNKAKWEEDTKIFEHHIQGLETSKSAYHELLEENRLLYNQIQDLKGNIRVYCRVRPFLTNQSDGKSTVDYIGENGNIMIVNPHKQGKEARKIFSFNRIFAANSTQYEVFDDTQPLIRSVLDGFNVCIFAYGQTGSGKTYTMSGPDMQTEETWGVNYRALTDLFRISQSRADIIRYEVSVQMIEIYNEQVRDLLVADGSNRRLDIRNNSQLNGLNIPDASLVPVTCTRDVLDLMIVGQGNRAIGATALNERSSRSHSVLTVHVQGKELVSGSVLRGCLHLVDLAGSERVNKSEATGERLKEAQHINRSLSALGDVISALAQKSSHIPYRNSKLTQVLQDALGGNAKTLMFVHINPEANAYGETISTLKFAERVASIELGAARANKETGEIRELKEEIAKLKSALENKELEAVQLRDVNSRLALEVQCQRTTSPVRVQKNVNSNSTKLKNETNERSANDPNKTESRSCSSGKRRTSRLPPPVSDKELDTKSPLSVGSTHINSRKPTSPSPPVRRSLSTDRASVIKRKPKVESVEEKPIVRLQFPEKMTKNERLRRQWDLQELDNPRAIPMVGVEEQFKTAISIMQSGTRKHRLESKSKPQHQQQTGTEKLDPETRLRAEVPRRIDFSETENKYDFVDIPLHSSPRIKKMYHVRRNSQNIEPRASVLSTEPLLAGKNENRLQIDVVRNGKEGKNSTELEFRRSRSLPRGKFTIIP